MTLKELKEYSMTGRIVNLDLFADTLRSNGFRVIYDIHRTTMKDVIKGQAYGRHVKINEPVGYELKVIGPNGKVLLHLDSIFMSAQTEIRKFLNNVNN